MLNLSFCKGNLISAFKVFDMAIMHKIKFGNVRDGPCRFQIIGGRVVFTVPELKTYPKMVRGKANTMVFRQQWGAVFEKIGLFHHLGDGIWLVTFIYKLCVVV